MPESKSGLQVRTNKLPLGSNNLIPILSLVVALLAAGVSLWSVFYQSKLANLPAVSVYFRWDYSVEADKNENDIAYGTIKWMIENTGRGPAVVHQAKLYLEKEKKFYDMGSKEARSEILERLEKHLGSKVDVVSYSSDTVSPGYAIAAGGEWALFEFTFRGVKQEKLYDAEVATMVICHCSFDGDCSQDDSDQVQHRKLLTAQECPDRVDIEELLRRS